MKASDIESEVNKVADEEVSSSENEEYVELSDGFVERKNELEPNQNMMSKKVK